MLELQKNIAEYQSEEATRDVWEQPDGYVSILAERPWIVTGRKGTGKSTLVEYIRLARPEYNVLRIRPDYSGIIPDIEDARASNPQATERTMQHFMRSLVKLFIYVEAMKKELPAGKIFVGSRATIYEFLADYGLIRGSVLRRLIDIARKVTKNFKHLDKVVSAFETKDSPSYPEAVAAFHKLYRNSGHFLLICLDDIDEFGFEFSANDRLMVKSLYSIAAELNRDLIESKIDIRMMMTPPSEVHWYLDFWHYDKIENLTRTLVWDRERLFSLVNKRIGVELKKKRRNPRYSGDLFTTEPDQTWLRVVPPAFYNHLGREEGSFDFLLRYTLYTPRTILTLTQMLLSLAKERGYKLGDPDSLDQNTWSEVANETVENYTIKEVKALKSTFGRMIPGIIGVLEEFRECPVVLGKGAINDKVEDAVRRTPLKVRGQECRMTAREVLVALYRMGVFGLGRQYKGSPSGASVYELDFSYLGSGEHFRGGWDLVVLSPVYWSYLDIDLGRGPVVSPHLRVNLPAESVPGRA